MQFPALDAYGPVDANGDGGGGGGGNGSGDNVYDGGGNGVDCGGDGGGDDNEGICFNGFKPSS